MRDLEPRQLFVRLLGDLDPVREEQDGAIFSVCVLDELTRKDGLPPPVGQTYTIRL